MKETFYISSGDPETKRRVMVRIGVLPHNYKVTIEKLNNQRSSAQNRYLHGVLIAAYQLYEAEQGTFLTPEQAKQALLSIVLPMDVVNRKTGEVHQIAGSSSGLGVDEFSELIERIHALYFDIGIVIPPPSMFGLTKDYKPLPEHTLACGE